MRKIKEVLRLGFECNLSKREIARSCRISRTTVTDYLRRATTAKLNWTEVGALGEVQIAERLFPVIPPMEKLSVIQRPAPDFEYIYNQLRTYRKFNLTLTQLWIEYKESHPDGYGYTQFAARFLVWRQDRGLPPSTFCNWRVPHIAQEDMAELMRWRRSSDRVKWAKAVVVIDSHRGIGTTSLSSKLEKSPRIVKRWIGDYLKGGMEALRVKRRNRQGAVRIAGMKQRRDRIISLLHETPQIHGINRTSWSLKSLAQAFEIQYGESIGKSTLSEYVKAEGYTFRKARRVLTSPDPTYREKLEEITGVLSNLRDDEKFFSIDEFGPFSVKMRGGVALTPQGTTRVVPQRQRSKGRLIVTAALELSTNQVSHFYSEAKNTDEMIKLLGVLLRQYSSQRCLYLSWDAASWHISAKLAERVCEMNNVAEREKGGTPVVKLMPLPSSAQFLNVIESVFSGMAKAILHNSDYASADDCRTAINRYFAERNEAYTRNPRRAGNTIWGKELVQPRFTPSNNCKDPNWR
ncbi:MAG: IS630 family transposase [Chloroflexi bacterium]|nr:IS630 family transposase [Chloroflexota bacterium]